MLLLILSAGSLLSMVGVDGITWKLAKNSNGIKVYTSKLKNSRIKAFKVTTRVKAEASDYIKALTDFPNYWRWLANCETASLISQPTPNEYIYYVRWRAPWPMSYRDAVVRMVMEEVSDTEIVCTLQNVKGHKKVEKNIVRLPHLNGHWKFISTPEGQLYIENYLHMDPGGAVPSWLVNTMLIDGPFNTIVQLKKFVHHSSQE